MNAIENQIKQLNDIHFPQIKRILNRNSHHLMAFIEATKQQDCEQGFDAIFTAQDVKIAIRIRKYEYLRYSDFTVRACTTLGNKTEIDKIREGFGDYYFYGWETPSGRKLQQYMIIDLSKVRAAGVLDGDGKRKIRMNNDGSGFVFIGISELLQADAIMILETFKKR